MNIEDLREFCLSIENVTEDMPFGDDVLIFRIENKIFCALALNSDEPRIVVKLAPEKNIELRDQYQAVEPAFHWNKKFWSDIYLHRDMAEKEVKQCIVESYCEVIRKLPKKIREKYPIIVHAS